nr:hypothetical protein CFP56_36481 [Quercus suber]
MHIVRIHASSLTRSAYVAVTSYTAHGHVSYAIQLCTSRIYGNALEASMLPKQLFLHRSNPEAQVRVSVCVLRPSFLQRKLSHDTLCPSRSYLDVHVDASIARTTVCV